MCNTFHNRWNLYFFLDIILLQSIHSNSYLFYRAFGGTSNLRIPHWLGVNGCLLEYLPLIQELFAQKVRLKVVSKVTSQGSKLRLSQGHSVMVLTLYSLTSVWIFSITLLTFLRVLTRRICSSIKSFFSWWSSPLFSWLKCLIQGRCCEEKLDVSHSKGLKG